MNRTNVLLRSAAILVILFDAAAAVHAQEDPLGGRPTEGVRTDDPFGSNDDPFTVHADPFGAPPGEGTRFAIMGRGIRRAEEMVKHPYWDDSFLEGSLSLLQHYGLRGGDGIRSALLLEGIARQWHTKPGVTTKQLWQRLRKTLVSDQPGPQIRDFRQLGTQYTLSFDKFDDGKQDQERNWSLDWRKQQVFWLDLVDLILRSQDGENVTSGWRDKVAADAAHADWYRLARLVLMRVDTAERDLPFIFPLVREDLPAVQQRWCVVYLVSRLQQIDVPEDHAARVRARERLFVLLREHPLYYSDAGARELLRLLGEARHYAGPDGETIPLADLLVEYSDPWAFEIFAEAAGFSERDKQEWYLAKHLSLTCDDELVTDVLDQLAGQVRLPVWIDNAVRREAARITLDRTSGTWWDVLHSVLDKTEYRLHLFQDSLLWIGKPSDLRNAETLLGGSLAKIPRGYTMSAAQAEEALRDRFIERVPLMCVFGQPSVIAVHDVHFLVLDEHDWPESRGVSGLPLHLELTLLCAGQEYDWTAVGGTIAVGSPDKVARFRKLSVKRLQRAVRWKRVHNRVTEALQGDSRFDFFETPLEQVAEFLADQHDIPVKVADDDRDRTVTMRQRCLTLGEALDELTFVLGLAWDADGQAIYMGNSAQVKALMRAAEEQSR